MLTQQQLCSRAHALAVQRLKYPAHATVLYAGAYGGLQQHIGITTRGGTGAGVKALGAAGHLDSPLHGNVLGEEGVGATYPGVGRTLQLGVEVNNLHQSVNTGVGAACTNGGHLLSSKAAQGRFEFVLYGVAIGLTLPASISLTVVADA